MQKYGFESDLPATYLLDAKIFPSDVRYIMKIIKYVIPISNQEVYDLKDGAMSVSNFSKIYDDCKYCKNDSVL